MIPSVEVRVELDRALTGFRAYVDAFVQERKASRGPDLISRLLAARDDGAEFTDRELADNCMLLFADGIGNVDSGIANMIATLTSHPDQFAELRASPERIPGAVDECLRFEAPGQFIARVATEELEMRGQIISRNHAVLLVLGAANRDPEKFPEPDRFDIRREYSGQHLSFGRGAHSCVGAYLVKTQMQAALRVIAREMPGLRRRDEALRWRARLAHRWIEALPVVVD
jgi:cytochrome P450